MPEKLSVAQVKLKSLPEPSSGELSENVFRKCHFCDKNCRSFSQLPFLYRLCGPGNFYCPFCLRHDLHTKNNKDFLILSFRSIIGSFYFQNYLTAQGGKRLWISEIEDYIYAHQAAGLMNPVFLYDPETMLWFINFSKVGTSKKKIPIEEVHKTILNILVSFNLAQNFPGTSLSAFYSKYHEAIESFYRKRFRPENRRMLIPSIGNEPKVCGANKLRNFVFDDLIAKK